VSQISQKKIFCVPLITSHMVLKGNTELECTETIPYLLPFTSATTTLEKPLTYTASSYISRATLSPCSYLKHQLPSPFCLTLLFHLFCLMTSKIFNLGKTYSFTTFSLQIWHLFFLRHLYIYFSAKGSNFSAINDSLPMWKVAFMHL